VVLKGGRPQLGGLAAVGAEEFRPGNRFILHAVRLGLPRRRVKTVFDFL
jgi:hypothetical protein